MLVFCVLGTNAAPAIPELTTLMKDSTRPKTSWRAIAALGNLGLQAFPHMTAALANTNHPNRDQAALYLATLIAPSFGTNACLPPLTAALNDPDELVRSTAAMALGYLTNAAPQ
jgi:HEAT repeat protein